jgi:hypothetical protein
MVKSDGQLYQALQKFLLIRRGGAPDVFQHFMRVEKLPFVEEPNASTIGGKIEFSRHR